VLEVGRRRADLLVAGALAFAFAAACASGIDGLGVQFRSAKDVVQVPDEPEFTAGPRVGVAAWVNPTTVNTDMIQNDAFYQYVGATTPEEMGTFFQSLHALPVPWVEAIDISNAVLFLASDESRYVTGLPLWVDAGLGTKVGSG